MNMFDSKKLITKIDNKEKLEDFINEVSRLDNKTYRKMKNSAFLCGYAPHLLLPSFSYVSVAIAYCIGDGRNLEFIDKLSKTIYLGTILNVLGYVMGAPLVPMLHVDISNYGAKYRKFYKIIKKARRGLELDDKLKEDYFYCRDDNNLFHMILIGIHG